MRRTLVCLAIVCLILVLGWEAGRARPRSRRPMGAPGARHLEVSLGTPPEGAPPVAAPPQIRGAESTLGPVSPTGGRIVGVLRGADGSPTPGLVALLSTVDMSDSHRFADADDRGRFAFDVEPGGWSLRGEGEDGLSEHGYVDVPEGETARIELKLQPTSTVQGTVRAHDGTPIPGARVTPIAQGFRRGADTNEQGEFVLRLLPNSYPLRAEARGHAAVHQTVEVRQGQETACEFQLGEPHRIAGRVLDSQDRPIAGAKVRARSEHGYSFISAFDTVAISDKDGRFELVDLDANLQSLTVSAKAFLEAEREHVRVDRQDVEFKLTGACSIAGRVLDLDRGEGIAGAQVYARPVQADHPVRPVRSGGDGSFELEGLGAGTWVVQARGAGYALGESDPIDLPAEGRVEGVLVQVERGGEIRGVVLRASTREPVRRSQAFLSCGPRDEWSPPTDELPMVEGVRTGEDGGFWLKSVPVGRHRVRVETWSPNAFAEATVDVEPGKKSSVELLLPDAEGRIVGRVISEAGVIGPETTVVMSRDSRSTRRADRVAPDGGFEFERLIAGEYTLEVESDHLHRTLLARRRVRICEGETLRCEIITPRGVRVSGTVRVNGAPAASSGILFVSDGTRRSGEVDAQGRYQLLDVPPGSYRVHLIGATTMCEVPDEGGEVARDIDLTTRGLRGRVLHPAGAKNPEGAWISVCRVGPGAARGVTEWAYSNSTSYRVSDLDPGEYVLLATGKGCGSLVSGPIVLPNDDGVVEHDLLLPAPVELDVVVVDATGKGQPRAEVDVFDATWGLPVPVEAKNGLTDHRGRLTLVGLGAGRYRLRAVLPDWTSEETLVEIVGSAPPLATVRVMEGGR